MDKSNQSLLALIRELSGFYNALRCSIGIANRNFDAAIFEKNGGTLNCIVDEQIRSIEESGHLTGKKVVDFPVVESLFNRFIYSKLHHLSEEQIYNLDWNLVEHYGLISMAEDENGKWNRLVSQEHTLLEYLDQHGREAVRFFVEHDSFVVGTYLVEGEFKIET